ncbi:MAG: 2-oxoglutarate dehydrogenase E1 component [Acidobacteria bacterium]|nr:2-oxoglutarate dehydrogenase E1 component [Acidobacteriota bacterium]
MPFIESLWRQYQIDPQSLDPSWRHFFMGVSFSGGMPESDDKSFAVLQLIRAYRKWGHLWVQLDPLGDKPAFPRQLELPQFGFDPAQLNVVVPSFGFLSEAHCQLGELLRQLQAIYCGHMGVEYMDGPDLETERWFQSHLEGHNMAGLSLDSKRRILENLNRAELFERFLHAKYVGQKRFSLEGGESLIPALAELFDALGRHGADQVILGMSHRGRLNVLANIVGKSYQEMFSEFEPNYLKGGVEGDGDVKYHKGYVTDFTTPSGHVIHLTLVDNPSHLEAVGPVVNGLARAHQEHHKGFKQIVPVVIHGDAAFPGQGVVAEQFNMAQLKGYATGGTVHIVINNQIGFTTDPIDARGSVYCTDIARQAMAPVFHVNGDDPETVVRAVRLAAEYRQIFQHDVVIDLVCYRRHGHNEGDEPSFTQPLMVKKLKARSSSRAVYVAELIKQGKVEAEVARELEQAFNAQLEEALAQAKGDVTVPKRPTGRHLHGRSKQMTSVETRVITSELMHATERLTAVPSDFNMHRKLARIINERRQLVHEKGLVDWSMAEQLAFATILKDGVSVRLSGQDVKRGTFSQRHAVWFDVKTSRPYVPLANWGAGDFHIHNSPLSEFAVLGFEFGFSLAQQQHLVIWEAQFGDFANGAQVIIDQFIASSESKWGLASNLVLFLPHGYEGQGPEHSSARLERFLQLCADDNMRVMNLTRPAQLFHALRQQALNPQRKPLIVMTPKSLLRHVQCVSSLAELTDQPFQTAILDGRRLDQATRLLVCSGKIYYDLVKQRDDLDLDMPILRLEQLYPLDESRLVELTGACTQLKQVIWVQEESQNMGAWSYIQPHLNRIFDGEVGYVGRDASASPAVGSLRLHQAEQAEILRTVFAPQLTGVVTV